MSGRSNMSDRSHKSRRLSKFVALKKLEMCKRQNSDCSKQPQVASLSCLACTFQFLATICVAAKRISFATFLWQDKEKLRKINILGWRDFFMLNLYSNKSIYRKEIVINRNKRWSSKKSNLYPSFFNCKRFFIIFACKNK